MSTSMETSSSSLQSQGHIDSPFHRIGCDCKANFKFELDKKNYSKNFEKYWLDETEKIPKPKEFNELNKELFKVYDQDIIKLKLIHFIRNNKNDFID